MRILKGRAAETRVRELATRTARLEEVEPVVRKVVAEVRRHGDRALLRYARKFDALGRGETLRVPEEELNSAWAAAPPELRRALQRAAASIRQFCQWQMPKPWRRSRNGVEVGQLLRPLDAVGCYVPGGRYPLPSTVLMTVIPAQVAGVKRICVVSPKPQPGTLAAAALLGVSEFYRIGGAQAVAAMAYGTQTIARVDKIVGPGNVYVTAAKKLVAFDCAIDMLAGPTEIVVVAEAGEPRFIASDLVAQAEHDPDAAAVFITTSPELVQAVLREVKELVKSNDIARQSLGENGLVLVAPSREKALEWANLFAAEHITVAAKDVPLIRNAGAVFVGDYSPQAVGDYASGPNHVLPTGGAARHRGGLSVYDYLKLITVQQLSRQGLRRMAATVTALADAEGLRAHGDSVRVRCRNA